MDVYHKVLLRIFEMTGGRDTQDVDFIELLKQEGFFPSLESIKGHLSTEGWITDSPRPNNVRITHWGVAEARKALSNSTGTTDELDRTAGKLLNAARDLSIVIEEFVAKPTPGTFTPIEKHFSDVDVLISKLKTLV